MCEILTLGAYGSRSQKGGTSAFMLNSTTLIDAGNVVVPLGEASADIDLVWLTHSHLDHIADLAFMIDNYFEKRDKPLRIRGLPQTLEAVQTHFFNHTIWPDFSAIAMYGSKEMTVILESIEVGEYYTIDETMTIKAFYTDHTVPSCGYIVTKEHQALLITADTHRLEMVEEAVKSHPNIRSLVIECAFPNAMEELAVVSKHLTPNLLFERLKPLESLGLKLYINHLKPTYETEIRQEIKKAKSKWDVTILRDGTVLVF